MKKNIKLIVAILFITLLLISSVSYAIFALTLRGKKEVSIQSGTLAVEFKDQNTIQLENTYPMSDSKGMKTTPYEFSIENTGDIKVIYDLSLEEEEKTKNTLDYRMIRYSLKRGDGEWSSPKNLDSLLLESNMEIGIKEKDSYQLKLWLDENIGNEGQEKEFRARVVANSVQSNANTKDTIPPVITLTGKMSVSMEQNAEYQEPGVESVSDNQDVLNKDDVTISYEYYNGSSTSKVESIDTSRLGVYYIYYKIKDKSNNEGVTVRSVNVYKKDTNAPVIRLKGEEKVEIEKGNEYQELGAEAEDIEDGDISNRIVTVGTVNTKKTGNYSIKYLITDQEGNTVGIIRIVNVIEPMPKTYMITYDASGGSGTMESQEVTEGDTITIRSNSFTKEGYTFAGWTSNENQTDDGYSWTDWSGTFEYKNGENGIKDNKLVLYAMWKRNFTCASAGGTTTYAGSNWYTVANDGENCTLALNTISSSTGTYAEAAAKLEAEYFKDGTILLKEKNAGLTSILGTYTASTALPSTQTGVLWTGASSASPVNRTFPTYSNKTTTLYRAAAQIAHSNSELADIKSRATASRADSITGYNTSAVSNCSSISGSSCVVNNGKIASSTVSNHGSTTYTSYYNLKNDINSNKIGITYREKETGGATSKTGVQFLIYPCGGSRHGANTFQIMFANSSNEIEYYDYLKSTNIAHATHGNYPSFYSAGLPTLTSSTVTANGSRGTQVLFNNAAHSSCVNIYTYTYAAQTYPIQYRLYIRVKM